MGFKSFTQTIILFASLTLISRYIYSRYGKKKTIKPPKEVHEALMFSKDDTIYADKKHYISKPMDRLIYYLNSSRHTIDICMYVLTNRDIFHILMQLFYKGVKVRIIVDADMQFAQGSYVRKLEKKGIPVRWMKSTNLMHHKFCLIDASTENSNVTPLLIAGSLNWTNQALFGNWEDIIVTSQTVLVEQYKNEFERLWVHFKPIGKSV